LKKTSNQTQAEQEKKEWEKPDYDILDIKFDTATGLGSSPDGSNTST
jgi:hypothetical protein